MCFPLFLSGDPDYSYWSISLSIFGNRSRYGNLITQILSKLCNAFSLGSYQQLTMILFRQVSGVNVRSCREKLAYNHPHMYHFWLLFAKGYVCTLVLVNALQEWIRSQLHAALYPKQRDHFTSSSNVSTKT